MDSNPFDVSEALEVTFDELRIETKGQPFLYLGHQDRFHYFAKIAERGCAVYRVSDLVVPLDRERWWTPERRGLRMGTVALHIKIEEDGRLTVPTKDDFK